MTKIQQLIDAVKTAGADLQAKGTKLQLYHPDKVSPELKSQLREKKPEILWELTKEAELEESLRRLEASAVCLAV